MSPTKTAACAAPKPLDFDALLEQVSREICAQLPPFTPEEAAAAGRLAAKLDARIAARADA
ncbi:MAG: hypothetical protein HOV79_00375 [Hamadaea sp.]|nr:hypothetical protein [Hamadaea sp.]